MHYSDLTRRHFLTAANAGVLRGATVRRGEAGSRTQGTWVQFDVELQSAESAGVATIRAVRFLAYGCPHVIAVADWLASRALGTAPQPVLPEDVFALQQRFAVPIEKRGRLLVVEDAWIAALSAPYPFDSGGGPRP